MWQRWLGRWERGKSGSIKVVKIPIVKCHCAPKGKGVSAIFDNTFQITGKKNYMMWQLVFKDLSELSFWCNSWLVNNSNFTATMKIKQCLSLSHWKQPLQRYCLSIYCGMCKRFHCKIEAERGVSHLRVANDEEEEESPKGNFTKVRVILKLNNWMFGQFTDICHHKYHVWHKHPKQKCLVSIV